MLSDLRYAFRQILKSPGFALVAIATLALGIGANTAIFSIVNALLLRPLPFPDANRIMQINLAPPGRGGAGASGGLFLAWQDRDTLFDSLAAIHQSGRNLTGAGEPLRITGLEVTADYLRVLGVNPVLGRGFAAVNDAPGGERHVIILTHELWQAQFQEDPAVIGRSIQLDGETYTVIGVLPPATPLGPNVSFLAPACIRADAWKQIFDYNYPCSVIGRLKADSTIAQATAEFLAVKQSLEPRLPSFMKPWGVNVQTLQEAIFGGSRPYVLTLMAAVGGVLLIACANVANLLLAKAAAREGEIVVRIALGASAGRIVRLLLAESILLSLAGGVVGVLLGAFAIDPLMALAGATTLPGITVGVDGRVLCFSLGVSLATGVLFGLFPALSVARPDLNVQLKEGSRGSTAAGKRRLQSILIVAETMLTVVLLVGTGLLLRSFVKAVETDPGFCRENVLAFEFVQPGTKVPTTGHRVRFIRDVLEHIQQIPGVASAGMVSSAPMNGRFGFGDQVSREEKPETRNDLRAGYDAVAGNYFQAAGIPLLKGRFFTEADNDEKAPRVAIIDATLARRLFEEEDPIGHQLHYKDATWEIVGVVGSVRQFALDVAPFPHLYYPQAFFPWYNTIVVRTNVPSRSLADDLRRAVKAVDPEQPIDNLRTLQESSDSSLQTRRTMLTFLGLFAGTALALACIGLYGVMAYAVTQRTRELGIRLALGSGSRGAIALVLRDGLKLVSIGIALGALGSLGAGRLVASQLYNVSATDPIVFALVAAALFAAALLACWLPARRATKVDPLTALRAE